MTEPRKPGSVPPGPIWPESTFRERTEAITREHLPDADEETCRELTAAITEVFRELHGAAMRWVK